MIDTMSYWKMLQRILFLNFFVVSFFPASLFAADNAGKGIIMYVFTAPDRCPPCKAMEPIIAEMKKDGFDVRVVNADSAEGQRGAQFYRIGSIPSFIIVDDKLNEVTRIEGKAPKKDLVNSLIPPADYAEKTKSSAPFVATAPISVKCDPIGGNPKNGYRCVARFIGPDGKVVERGYIAEPSSESYKNISKNPKGPFQLDPASNKIVRADMPQPEKPRGTITGITELPPVPGDIAEGVICELVPATKTAEEYYKCLKKDGTPLLVGGRRVVVLPEDEDVWQAIQKSLAGDKNARFAYDMYKNELMPPTSKPDVVRKDEPAFIDPFKNMPRQYQRSVPSPRPSVVNDVDPIFTDPLKDAPQPKSPRAPQPKGSMKK